MENALWSLEDKWKLSTREAGALFACSAFLAIVICSVSVIVRKRSQRKGLVHQEPGDGIEPRNEESLHQPWGPLKKMLMDSVRWSRAMSIRDQERRGLSLSQSQKERASPLLVMRGFEDSVSWHSHDSTSAVWKRPILMGGKCELPRFSGLILYDEKGAPLDHRLLHEEDDDGIVEVHDFQDVHQEMTCAADVRTTLRDLL